MSSEFNRHIATLFLIYLNLLALGQSSRASDIFDVGLKQFPSAEKVARLADLTEPSVVTLMPATTNVSAITSLLNSITQKCGWPDPAVLAWTATRSGNEQLNAKAGDFTNLQRQSNLAIQLPSCVYLSPAEVTIEADNLNQTNQLIPGVEVRMYVANTAINVKNAISEVPSGLKYDLAKPGDFIFNIEPGVSNNRQALLTPNGGEAVRIASDYIRMKISAATFEERRKVLFSRIVKEATAEILNDPEKRPGIARAGIQPRKWTKVSFLSGYSSWFLTQEFGDTFDIQNVRLTISLVENGDNPMDRAAVQECNSGLDKVNNLTWPLPVEQLIDVLQMNDVMRSRSARGDIERSRILVADTGYPSKSLDAIASKWDEISKDPSFLFPSEFLLKVSAKPEGKVIRLGINAGRLSADGEFDYDVEPFTQFQLSHHGMWVASLALGGAQMGFWRKQKSSPPLQIHFASLMTETVVPGGSNKYEITRENIARVLRYALLKQIRIVNWSFTTRERLHELESFVKENHMTGTLFISAAGNEGEELANGQERWPAAYGGQLEHGLDAAFVTVGAYRADGKPFSRSNRGAEYVDLLAPGCSLVVPDLVEGIGSAPIVLTMKHGTSFAAPVVSFVSALLMSERLSPFQIKRRLVLSAEHDINSISFAQFGAKLDPVTALSVYHDVVEFADSKQWIGHVTEETLNSTINTCDLSDSGFIKFRRLLRFDKTEARSGQAAQVNFYVEPPSSNSDVATYRKIPCPIESGANLKVQMKLTYTGDVVDVDISKVRRIVMRSHYYEE